LAGGDAIGGVRVALCTRVIPSATVRPLAPTSEGKEVRLTGMDGVKRTGKLVSLSSSAVVIRAKGQDVSIPLNEVHKVEKVAHHDRIGAAIGAAWAAIGWMAIAATRDTCGDCEDGPNAMMLLTPIYVGAGAGIGAMINAATRGRHLLYLAPESSGSVSVAPIVGPKRAGVGVAMRW
jgi:hypothetical protein